MKHKKRMIKTNKQRLQNNYDSNHKVINKRRRSLSVNFVAQINYHYYFLDDCVGNWKRNKKFRQNTTAAWLQYGAVAIK